MRPLVEEFRGEHAPDEKVVAFNGDEDDEDGQRQRPHQEDAACRLQQGGLSINRKYNIQRAICNWALVSAFSGRSQKENGNKIIQ